MNSRPLRFQKNKIFVMDYFISWKATLLDLRNFFEKVGGVVDIFMAYDPSWYRQSGSALVEFSDEDSAKNAIKQLDKTLFFGKELKMRLAHNSEKLKLYGNTIELTLKTVESYNIFNGFLGMKRNVALKLIQVLNIQDLKIKMLMLISKECWLWKDHGIFKETRCKLAWPAKYLFVPSTVTLTGPRKLDVIFGAEYWSTMFFDRKVTEGITKMIIAVDVVDDYNFRFGAVLYSDVDELKSTVLGTNYSNAVSYMLWDDAGHIFNGNESLADDGFVPPSYRFNFCRGVRDFMVAVEVDMNKRTLHFFVQDRQVGIGIGQIPSPVCFGFTGCMQKVRFTALQRLSQPTVNLKVQTAEKLWKGEDYYF